MRCLHEVIVGFVVGDDESQVVEEKTVVCSNCGDKFAPSTGGKCMDCKSQIVYCSRDCQVKLKTVIIKEL